MLQVTSISSISTYRLIILLEIITVAQSRPKVFEANDRSTYSNVAFSLLGLALEKATGKSYSEIISSSILQPLGLDNTTTTKPKDSDGIIPWGLNDWRQDLDSNIPYISLSPELERLLRLISTQNWRHLLYNQ
jgi:CubicO group peptidase (beta-lactamase class C family)